ncbi:hypothetical protein N9U05_00515 [bacterium]|nr:hypothetical protein [bacterium]
MDQQDIKELLEAMLTKKDKGQRSGRRLPQLQYYANDNANETRTNRIGHTAGGQRKRNKNKPDRT